MNSMRLIIVKNYSKIQKFATVFACLALILFFASSFQQSQPEKLFTDWKKGIAPSGIDIMYPANNTIFPPEIAPTTIYWNDSTGADLWIAYFLVNDDLKETSPVLSDSKWLPEKEQWEKIKNLSIEKNAKLLIIGFNKSEPNKILTSAQILFRTSKDSVGAPIFFRTVTLPFKYAINNLETISWRLGKVSSSSRANILIEKLPVCANCHSFSSDGKVIGMDVDYANDKGSYAISDISDEIHLTIDKIISWSDFKQEDGKKTYGLLSSVSPDGRYVASTVKDRSIFVSLDDLMYSQLFFPIKGIIAIYDRKEKKYFALKGADDTSLVQSNPIWSPDGKYLYICRTKAFTNMEAEKSGKAILPTSVAKEFIDGTRRFFYDIYRIPFNGGKGGTAEPFAGASGNDMSNYFPKFSPDGKWVVFTQSKNFMLLQPDSKLYIMPANGGLPRLMNCNTDYMNSWHSFSPNGKWLVFSSKVKGAYTKLYLTHIDENGMDSPPVCLEYMSPDNLAANIPEFLNISPEQKIKIIEKFMNSNFYAEARVNEKAKAGDFKGALADLDSAISVRPLNSQLYYDKAMIQKKLGDFKNARINLDKCIELNQKNDKAYFERAYLKVEAEDYKGAVKDLEISLKLEPRNFMAVYEMAVAKYNLKDYKNSIKQCDKLVSMNPNFGYGFFQRALCRIQLNQIELACPDLKKADGLGCREAKQVIEDYCNGEK